MVCGMRHEGGDMSLGAEHRQEVYGECTWDGMRVGQCEGVL